jgi:hypothetical protein
MVHQLHDKDGKRILRPGSGKPDQPLDDVQREIVMADMKYLIEKEKESGDWAKWQDSQRPINQLRSFDRIHVTLTVTVQDVQGNVYHIATPGMPMEHMRFEPETRYESQEMPSHIMARESDRRQVFDLSHPELLSNDTPPHQIRPQMPTYYTGQITADIWRQFVGRAPIMDDIERANCRQEGIVGHYGCGWCHDCQRPRWLCGHRVIASGRAT